jgi:hypothetical protein
LAFSRKIAKRSSSTAGISSTRNAAQCGRHTGLTELRSARGTICSITRRRRLRPAHMSA